MPRSQPSVSIIVAAAIRAAAIGAAALLLAFPAGPVLAQAASQAASQAPAQAPEAAPALRTVTDMRGVEVTFPADLTRVATIDDGFVEGIMTYLGVIGKVTSIGSWSLKRDYNYDYETASGERFSHRGLNTMRYLHPWLDDLPCFNSPQGDVINFEVLAQSAPQLVILRVGDCTVGSSETEKAASTIETINALGIPVVVLRAPAGQAELATMRTEIETVGEIFGLKERASELYAFLKSAEDLVEERTRGIPDSERARVLYLGLNPDLRKSGAVGAAFGTNTPESFVIETLAHAQNAFRGEGHGVPLNLEKIYALDPDVIVLPTYNGYHPPRELLEAPYFKDLGDLRAIREGRVYALPWTPMNCARRLEYPLDILITAKAAYPERFRDVSVHDYAAELYRKAYGVDDAAADGLRRTQILDWMEADAF